MKIEETLFPVDRPKRRPLKIFASDPMAGRTVGNRARVEVENERLDPGPAGERVQVVDYNSAIDRYYPPVNLDDPNILMAGGMDPTESDPRFHQQMVYAVAMRTLENFDRALGRRIYLTKKGVPLRLFPHAFHGANAFYDSRLNAILFGFFRANPENPGKNLPGQMVFTCLSHDVIAHEMTHAIVHRLRPRFLEPSNRDVLAFHEGFSDIVALFQHFSFPEIVRDHIGKGRGSLAVDDRLTQLAMQFGHATGMGAALRSAIGNTDRILSDSVEEPHERGSILVAAVFDGFRTVFERRTRDLLRLASGGTGNLPDGDIHPDLVNRLSQEASRIAQQALIMCIRAFDYLPPVDVSFGDFLRAMVTADFELAPEDEMGMRGAMIEAFRLRHIFPEGVTSLAEESLLWEPAPRELPRMEWEPSAMLAMITEAATSVSEDARGFRRWRDPATYSGKLSAQYDIQSTAIEGGGAPTPVELHGYAMKCADLLGLDPQLPIQVAGFHPVFRVAPSGRLAIELVVQFIQQEQASRDNFGGLPARGGTTLVAGFDGSVRYAIAKPLPHFGLAPELLDRATKRLERQAELVGATDRKDPMVPYMSADEFATRSFDRSRFSALHLDS